MGVDELCDAARDLRRILSTENVRLGLPDRRPDPLDQLDDELPFADARTSACR
jgi:hypothetical protein